MTKEDYRRHLIEWVHRYFPESSKRTIKDWITEGRIKVAGNVISKPHEMIADPAGQLVLLDRAEASQSIAFPLRIHPLVSILHLDAFLTVVDKGAGVASVPSGLERESVLGIIADEITKKQWRAVTDRSSSLSCGKHRATKPMPVHRLDRFTTGVMCCAMNSDTRGNLIAQFRRHDVGRRYIAYAEGRIAQSKGTWTHLLLKVEGETRQRAVVGSGLRSRAKDEAREAITHFERLEEFRMGAGRTVTKLLVTLETGRTHQVRAQAAAAGVPLIGDRLYNPAYQSGLKHIPPVMHFDRQALHAEHLELRHPESGAKMQWHSPLPSDLQQLEATLKKMTRARH